MDGTLLNTLRSLYIYLRIQVFGYTFMMSFGRRSLRGKAIGRSAGVKLPSSRSS